MTTFYSATANSFYAEENLPLFSNPPSDLIEVSDSVVAEFSVFTNGEKVRVAGKDGLPAWGDRPPLDAEGAGILKSGYMSAANEKIAPLQDATDLDIATDEEKTALIAWKTYRVNLMRIDTTKAPDIDWPVMPS